MAGQPITNQRLALLREHVAGILEYVEQGESMRRIALRMSDKLQEPISEAMIGRLYQEPGIAEQVSRARERAADSKAERMVERTTQLVDHVALGIKGRDDIAAVREANAVDQWIAGVWNRPKYGQQTGAQVTVNVATLHLDALRVAPAVEAVRPPELDAFDVVDVEARVVEPLSLSDLL